METLISLINNYECLTNVLWVYLHLKFLLHFAGRAGSHNAIDADINEINKRKSCYVQAGANNCKVLMIIKHTCGVCQ